MKIYNIYNMKIYNIYYILTHDNLLKREDLLK